MGGMSTILMKYITPTDKNNMQTVGTAPKSNKKVEETEFRIKPLTHIQDILLSWLGPDT